MAWNGLGAYVKDPAYSPEVNGTIVDAVRYNGLTSDIAAGITACLAKNGENVPTANLPMGGFKHTGAAAATAAGQYLTWGQGAATVTRVQKIITADTTLALTDAGVDVVHLAADTTARTVTIPANGTVAFPIETQFAFTVQPGSGALTLVVTTDTLIQVGYGTVSSYTFSPGDSAELIKLTSTIWFLRVYSPPGIIQNSQSAAYTLIRSDAGKHIYHPSADTTARIWTIPSNASVPFPIGTVVTFINDSSAGVITLAITSDTLVWSPTGGTGSRALAANGIATALKMTATRWQISGVGLT